jgi:CheY-like chemotaxis protein
LTFQTIRILLVDDNETIRHTLASLLCSDAEFKLVGECVSGAEAISRAGQLHPDVILLDISLPDINGLEVAR